MKPWPILLALGVIALATGAAMVVLQYHHTVGLAAVGLGVVLLLAGVGMAYLGRNAVKLVDKQTVVPAKRQGGLRKALIAVLVVVIIGVGTFYGTSYLGSIQPGNSFSSLSISSTTSSQTQGGNTTTFSSTPPVILHIFNLSSHNLTESGGNNVTLTGSYINNGTTTISVNIYLATLFSNGTVFNEGFLFYPESNGSQVQPNNAFQVDVNLGTFSPGGYSVSFFLIDATTGQQISVTTDLQFTAT